MVKPQSAKRAMKPQSPARTAKPQSLGVADGETSKCHSDGETSKSGMDDETSKSRTGGETSKSMTIQARKRLFFCAEQGRMPLDRAAKPQTPPDRLIRWMAKPQSGGSPPSDPCLRSCPGWRNHKLLEAKKGHLDGETTNFLALTRRLDALVFVVSSSKMLKHASALAPVRTRFVVSPSSSSRFHQQFFCGFVTRGFVARYGKQTTNRFLMFV